MLPKSTLSAPFPFFSGRRSRPGKKRSNPRPITSLGQITSQPQPISPLVQQTEQVTPGFVAALHYFVNGMPKHIQHALHAFQWQIIGCGSYNEVTHDPRILNYEGSRGFADAAARDIFIPEHVTGDANFRNQLKHPNNLDDLQEDVLHEIGHAMDRISAYQPYSQAFWSTTTLKEVGAAAGSLVGSIGSFLLIEGVAGKIIAGIGALIALAAGGAASQRLHNVQHNLDVTSDSPEFQAAYRKDIEAYFKQPIHIRRQLAAYLQHPQEAFAESFFSALVTHTTKSRFITKHLKHSRMFIQQHLLNPS